MRGLFIIGFAVLLDFLQGAFAMFFVVLQAVTPVGGGLAAAGFCYAASSNVVSGAYNALACAVVGAGVSAYAVPIGGAIDVVLSITFGVALIAVLAFSGMFYPGVVIGSFMGETIPLLNAVFPGWTLMAIQCARKKAAEEKAAQAAGAAKTQVLSQVTQNRERLWQDVRTGGQEQSYAEVVA